MQDEINYYIDKQITFSIDRFELSFMLLYYLRVFLAKEIPLDISKGSPNALYQTPGRELLMN